MGRAGKPVYGEHGPTYGSGGVVELVEAVREVEAPAPDALEAAVERWSGEELEVDALARLREVQREAVELREQREALEARAAELIASGESEGDVLEEVAAVERMVASRLRAVPAIERRIVEELREAYSARLEELEAEQVEAREELEARRGGLREARAAEAEAAAAVTGADGVVVALREESLRVRRRLRDLERLSP